MAPAGLAADKIAMGYYLSIWGLFTALMFVGTLTHNKATQVVFGSLTVLFALLALGDFTGNETITLIAGIVGIFCGFSAFYNALAQIINGEHKKTIFPL
jgi:succinate-acetate transporter protein